MCAPKKKKKKVSEETGQLEEVMSLRNRNKIQDLQVIHLLFTEDSSEMVSVQGAIFKEGKQREKSEVCQIITPLDRKSVTGRMSSVCSEVYNGECLHSS